MVLMGRGGCPECGDWIWRCFFRFCLQVQYGLGWDRVLDVKVDGYWLVICIVAWACTAFVFDLLHVYALSVALYIA